MQTGAWSSRWSWLLLPLALWLSAPHVQAQDTIAVWDFDNNTVGPMADIQGVEHLRRILPEALLARLTQVPGLRVVERVKLREILEEQKLASSELAEQESRLRLGRILGARRMVFGDFVALGPMLRVDVRLVDTATSQVLVAEPLIGTQPEALAGMATLANRIAETYGKTVLAEAPEPRVAADIWSAYDEGLRQMDEKRYDQAIETFKRVLTLDARFTPAERQIALALERLARGP